MPALRCAASPGGLRRAPRALVRAAAGVHSRRVHGHIDLIAIPDGAAHPGRRGVSMSVPEFDLADWRRRIQELYAAVRAQPDPEHGHALWRAGRDDLCRSHPQSPLSPDDPMRAQGSRTRRMTPSCASRSRSRHPRCWRGSPSRPTARAPHRCGSSEMSRCPRYSGHHSTCGGWRNTGADSPAAAGRERGGHQRRRRALRARHGKGRRLAARRVASRRPELPLPPVLPL